MERSQAIKLVEETFTQGFDDTRFLHFSRNLLNHLDESKRQTWTLRKAAFEDYVNHFSRLGTYADPSGERLDVLVIHLRRETTLSRGRVTLRNFVADYLASGHGQGKAAVLAAFVSSTEEDWRFSFVKLDFTMEKTDLGIITERALLTPARRYSYLVGKNEKCHTAQKQFLQLLETDSADPTVAQLEAAFKVEKVTKEFFEHYRRLFEKARDALNELLEANRNLNRHFDERGIKCDNFAKKLLGQIVFLYFLQKKGWFGVERTQAWGKGRKDFIRHLFEDRAHFAHLVARKSRRDPNFFNDVLEPLFYDALSRPRLEEDHYYPNFDCRIPFLNGGLFEPLYGYKWEETDILLPDSLFSNNATNEDGDIGTGILDVFDRYNFTVNEAEPLEVEVAVDPEMLGKVFENLLPEYEKHRSGTYYTPRVIVHYMCQQSLLQYLSARATNVPPDDLALFLRLAERFADFEAKKTKAHADKGLPLTISQNAAFIDSLLAAVTVCDPAIGSGAFPVGMMHEIVRARMALTPVLVKGGGPSVSTPSSAYSDRGKQDAGSRSAYALKRHAIHHSLYGVDLDPGAVEIAKLRLWLSMIVDEDNIGDIQPLPNLDYKIMQGNSLLEEFEGVRLFNERALEQPLKESINPRVTELEKQQRHITQEINRLATSNQLTRTMAKSLRDEGAQIARQLKALEKSVPFNTGDQAELGLGPRELLNRIEQLQGEFFDENSRTQKTAIREELNSLEWEFMRATLHEQGREEALGELEKANATHQKPFFLWWLHFSEVKKHLGGFDIVMANPPFVRMELIMHDKPALKRRFPHLFSGRADLYVYFFGLAFDILRENGCLAFISSNTYLNSKFGENLRTYFHENSTITTVIDFAETKVFDAVVEPAIIVLRKSKLKDVPIRILKWQEGLTPDELQETVARLSGSIPQSSFTSEPWRLESPKIIKLLDYLQSDRVSTPLARHVEGDVFRGVVSGLNEAFVIDADTRARLITDPRSQEIIMPFIRGRDISRWTTQPVSSWLIYTYHGIDIEGYPLIKDHLLPYKNALESRATEQAWYELQQPQYRYCKFFEQPKIVYQDIARYFGMAWDDSGAYLANTCYFIPTQEKWLLGVLLSTTMQFYVQKTIGSEAGGFIRLFAMHVKKFPVPHATDVQKGIIERLVEYQLWLRRELLSDQSPGLDATATLMAGYFEQWINALVSELFFPEELHSASIHFFRLAHEAQLPSLSAMRGKERIELQKIFEKLYSPQNALRQALFALDSIEQIRIIEGKP